MINVINAIEEKLRSQAQQIEFLEYENKRLRDVLEEAENEIDKLKGEKANGNNTCSR